MVDATATAMDVKKTARDRQCVDVALFVDRFLETAFTAAIADLFPVGVGHFDFFADRYKYWLLIVSPHAQNLYRSDIFQNLVDQSVLNIDPSGTGTSQITSELFIGRGSLVWIFRKDFEQLLRFRFHARC